MIVSVFRKIKNFLIDDGGVVKEVSTTLPEGKTKEAAAMDLRCLEEFTIAPGKRHIVETGLIIRAPRNFCLFILPRSGLAASHGITVMNSPGLIDRDYCGPNDTIKVILGNLGDEPVSFKAGDRIGQVMIIPVTPVDWKEEDAADFAGNASRGGLGSTGVK